MILKIQTGISAALGYARQLKLKKRSFGFPAVFASKCNGMDQPCAFGASFLK
jgi:hypothetical protein